MISRFAVQPVARCTWVMISAQRGAAALPPVFPIRCCASALVIGALGFFLCLALNAWQQASQGDDPVARKSAAANLCASVLVLAAALLRLDDLLFLQRCQPALEESGDLPV